MFAPRFLSQVGLTPFFGLGLLRREPQAASMAAWGRAVPLPQAVALESDCRLILALQWGVDRLLGGGLFASLF